MMEQRSPVTAWAILPHGGATTLRLVRRSAVENQPKAHFSPCRFVRAHSLPLLWCEHVVEYEPWAVASSPNKYYWSTAVKPASGKFRHTGG